MQDATRVRRKRSPLTCAGLCGTCQDEALDQLEKYFSLIDAKPRTGQVTLVQCACSVRVRA